MNSMSVAILFEFLESMNSIQLPVWKRLQHRVQSAASAGKLEGSRPPLLCF